MKSIFRLAAVAVVALSLNSCCQCDAPKFNAKEFAKNKTERLDKIVDLTDAQEKEIYNIYLAQGKEMKKNMASAKKAFGEMKCPDGKKAEGCKPCPPKPECGVAKPCAKPCDKKAECEKPCAKKAEGCKKAECDKPCAKKTECPKKAECDKPCAKKAECPKKAECEKPCAKKAECPKKAECDKPCAKKAEGCKKTECGKPCPPKPECGMPQKPHIPHDFVSPETKRATFEKIKNVLTEEQNNLLREHFVKRHHFAPKMKQCATTEKAPCTK